MRWCTFSIRNIIWVITVSWIMFSVYSFIYFNIIRVFTITSWIYRVINVFDVIIFFLTLISWCMFISIYVIRCFILIGSNAVINWFIVTSICCFEPLGLFKGFSFLIFFSCCWLCFGLQVLNIVNITDIHSLKIEFKILTIWWFLKLV